MVERSIPVRRAIAERERPCRWRSKIIKSPPSVTTAASPPVQTGRMVHDGPTSAADTLQAGKLGHLRDFTSPDLSSIHPASTRRSELARTQGFRGRNEVHGAASLRIRS